MELRTASEKRDLKVLHYNVLCGVEEKHENRFLGFLKRTLGSGVDYKDYCVGKKRIKVDGEGMTERNLVCYKFPDWLHQRVQRPWFRMKMRDKEFSDLPPTFDFYVSQKVPGRIVRKLFDHGYRHADLENRNVFYMDIEVLNDGTMPDPSNPDVTIGCICGYLNDEERSRSWICCRDEDEKSERKMLKRFREFLEREKVTDLVAHNGRAFDYPYIINRAERLSVKMNLLSDAEEPWVEGQTEVSAFGQVVGGDMNPHWPHLNLLDSLRFCQEDYVMAGELSSFSLGNVAEHYNLSEKLDMDHQKLTETFATEEGKDRVVTYCCRDALIVREICNKFDFIRAALSVAEVGGALNLERACMKNRSYLIENSMTFACPEGEYMWSDCRDDPGSIASGGGVCETVMPGMFPFVASGDYTSLYPNNMRAKNLGPFANWKRYKKWKKKTKFPRDLTEDDFYVIEHGPECHSAVDYFRRGGVDGEFLDPVVKQVMRYLDLRAKVKKEKPPNWSAKEKALKLFANATYGVLNSQSELSNRYCGRSICMIGRMAQKMLKDFLIEKGMMYLSGDTDSAFFTLRHHDWTECLVLDEVGNVRPNERGRKLFEQLVEVGSRLIVEFNERAIEEFGTRNHTFNKDIRVPVFKVALEEIKLLVIYFTDQQDPKLVNCNVSSRFSESTYLKPKKKQYATWFVKQLEYDDNVKVNQKWQGRPNPINPKKRNKKEAQYTKHMIDFERDCFKLTFHRDVDGIKPLFKNVTNELLKRHTSEELKKHCYVRGFMRGRGTAGTPEMQYLSKKKNSPQKGSKIEIFHVEGAGRKVSRNKSTTQNFCKTPIEPISRRVVVWDHFQIPKRLAFDEYFERYLKIALEWLRLIPQREVFVCLQEAVLHSYRKYKRPPKTWFEKLDKFVSHEVSCEHCNVKTLQLAKSFRFFCTVCNRWSDKDALSHMQEDYVRDVWEVNSSSSSSDDMASASTSDTIESSNTSDY